MSRTRPEMHLNELIQRYPVLQKVQSQILESFYQIRNGLRSGGMLFTCGNGGSAADAEHIVGELLKGFLLRRPLCQELQAALIGDTDNGDGAYLARNLQQGLRAVALTGHPSLITAMGNDVGYDLIFAQQLLALGNRGDILLGISTSGNARNVQLAARVAKVMGIVVIGLSGATGGALREWTDQCICIPETCTPAVQELHLPVYHTLCAMLEADFFGECRD